MVERRRVSTSAWVGTLVLGLVAFIAGLTGFVLMAVWGEWPIGTIIGAFGALLGGVSCTTLGISGIRSREGSEGHSA